MPHTFMEKYVMIVLLLSAEANATFQQHRFEQVELTPKDACFRAILTAHTGSTFRCASTCSRDKNCAGFLTDAADNCFVIHSNGADITKMCDLSDVRYFRLLAATTPTSSTSCLTPDCCTENLQYAPSTDRCTINCAVFANTYREIKDAFWDGYLISELYDVTLEDCQAACTADETCTVVNYDHILMKCRTIEASGIYVGHPGFEFYIRNCA